MPLFQKVSEGFARKTSRRGLFGRGAEVLFGTLAGVAVGTAASSAGSAVAGQVFTSCSFPGPPCTCGNCRDNGVCAKPCVILTTYYATGCWTSLTGATCCDCHCPDIGFDHNCGCGTDYQNDIRICP